MVPLHLLTPEFPPAMGGVSEHSRVLAETAVAHGHVVHVWTAGPHAGGGGRPGIEVHPTLGDFGTADLQKTGRLLDAFPQPRTIVLQWVPHGFGQRGMNLGFARWIAGRARAGDRIDVMVHEPFVGYVGGSWIQPLRAVVQRSMTRAVVQSARRVWLSIPGWQPRLQSMLAAGQQPRVLPVPGTIPIDRDPRAVAAVRQRLVAGGTALVGYFGGGGAYVETALSRTIATLAARRPAVKVVLIGRGTEELKARLDIDLAGATGPLDAPALSRHLQACDVLVQPYVDGVSGRRTTTVSALEHSVPVATTFGSLSEPFWRETAAVETVSADAPEQLVDATERLLEPGRNAEARVAALALYASRFDPRVALAPLFAD